MCGICGIAALDGPLAPALREALFAMTRALRHRGPDAEGFHREERAALGHRRLAIIDRAGGGQPMANEDGTCFIVFNGEIYNHVALRRELSERGHVFRTRSDTEAILHAYEEWGPACVERLEGMFAFAIYDKKSQELFLARDRLGKKPLFYALLGGALHFASEIKAIAKSPAWNGALDLSSIEGYLSLGYFLAPATIYRHVRKLEPAHWLRLRNGRIELRRYWDIERFDDDRRAAAAIRADLDALLRERVSERLESEVPLGAFLSGGIDSGLVFSYMAESLGERLVTTSVGFGDAAHDELGAAAITARHFGARHFAERVEPRLEDVLDRIVEAFDEPFADSSAIPTYYVSAMARRHVTVALSGDGGDESFAGYDFRYVPHAIEERARALFPRRAAAWLGARWPRGRRLPRPLRLGSVFENLSGDPAGAYYRDLCFLKPPAARALLGRDPRGDPRESPVYEAVTAPYRRCPSKSAVTRAQYADLMVYLPNDVLVKVDRMSMLCALEVRCPLLDRRVVEFAFRLPIERKMPRLCAKHLLRRLARERLPREIARLPKRGFTAPVGRWIAREYAGRFEDEVLGGALDGLVDPVRARALFEEHRAGRADHGYALWALWVLAKWKRGEALRSSPAIFSGRAASH
jgi:asparagine synthase (glutamine-hydrolysing)